MKSCIRRISSPLGLACLLAAGQASQISYAQDVTAPPPGADVQLEGGAEILTRGPVHEAFAEPFSVSVETPLIIQREPPEPINEIPPDAMPEGDDVEWIPGYWGWDDDRSDFIWVSGLWRNVPPGQRWVPGSWASVGNGYQWSSGFWTPVETVELVYQPDPPPSQEEGPNTPAPDDDHFWVPGVWRHVENDYSWQPGYWAPAYQDWTWMPAHNVWTPHGWVYCAGFWDYNPVYRGMLFSPVYFPNYTYPQFVPQTVVSIGPLLINLFVRPQYGHYYYGNYYGSNFVQAGIVPWLGVGDYGYYRYDPLLSFYQTGYFNGDGGFLGRISGWHRYYHDNPDWRPARTYAEMRDFGRRRGDRDANIVRQASLAQSLDEYRRSEDRHLELREVKQQDRERIESRSRETRELQQQRRQARTEGREDAHKLRLKPTDRRGRVEGLPDRPDRDRDPRRVARPYELDERQDAETRSKDRPNRTPRPDRPERDARERPDRTERDGRNAVTEQPDRRERQPEPRTQPEPRDRQPERGDRQPEPKEARPDGRDRQPSDQRSADQRRDGERNRGAKGSGRGRPGIAFPDAPANSGEEVRRIPRPSQESRRARKIEAPVERERGADRKPDRDRRQESQPQPNPRPDVTPPAGNRGKRDAQPGNRRTETPRANPGAGRESRPQVNPNAGRKPNVGNRGAGEAGRNAAAAAAEAKNRQEEKEKQENKRDNRRP